MADSIGESSGGYTAVDVLKLLEGNRNLASNCRNKGGRGVCAQPKQLGFVLEHRSHVGVPFEESCCPKPCTPSLEPVATLNPKTLTLNFGDKLGGSGTLSK